MIRFSVPRKAILVPFFLGALIGVGGTAFGATLLGSARFSDVQRGSFYDAPVGRMVDRGIIKGYPDGTFHPDQFATRAEIAVMFDRAFNGSDTVFVSSSSRSSSSSSEGSSTSSSSVSSQTVTAAGSIHFTTTGFNVGEGSKKASLTVLRTGGKKGEVKVDYAFGGGTAVSGTDYAPATGTLSFADGETMKTISVNVMHPDGTPSKTLEVTLSNATNGAVVGSPAKATLTMLGNGVASSSSSTASTSSTAGAGSLSFSANTYAVDENGSSATITVRRTNGSSSSVSVNYALSNGTATAGTHYSASQGTLSFGAGETSKSFSIQVLDNTTIDGNKTVNLALSTPTGGANIIDPRTAVLTIIDTDAGPSSASGSINYSLATYNASKTTGFVTITVLRQLGNAGTVNVNYNTSDGSAVAASDYTSTSGTLTFAPGETSKSFNVPILSTAKSERVFNLTLSSVSGPASLGGQPTATVKIQ